MRRRHVYADWRLLTGASVTAVFIYATLWKNGWLSESSRQAGPEAGHAELDRTQGYRFEYGKFCDELLNSGGWIGEPLVSCEASTGGVATCGHSHAHNWQWSSVALRCGAQRLSTEDLRVLLQGKWVAFAGDSVARYIFAALLRQLSTDEDRQIVLGHRNFEFTLPGEIKASYYWAPYAENVTALFNEWGKQDSIPDALVVSVGLWHMLHMTSAPAFKEDLQNLRAAADSFVSWHDQKGAPPLTLCSITEVFPPKLRAEDKRQKMTLRNVDAYNRAVADSNLLVPNGPMYLLDIHHLTQGCGGQCTTDGVHYSNATYDGALQIWANNLRLFTKTG